MKTFSLRARLTLLLAIGALVALGGAAKVVDWRADSEMQQRFDASLLARSQAFAAQVHNGDSGIEIDAVADQAARFPGGASNDWYIVTCEGRTMVQSHPVPPPISTGVAPHFVDAHLPNGLELREVAFRFRLAADEDGEVQRAGSRALVPRCELRYALNREPLDGILHTLDWILLGSILSACALVLIMTPWLVLRGLRPLTVLDRAMVRIGPDAPDRRLPASGTTELVPLVTRFNEVLTRMDDGLTRERQFASGLAHEFRTRLAELHMLVDVETSYPSGHDLRTVLGEVGSITTELEVTVTALLQLTRIESGLEQSHVENLALGPLLRRTAARHLVDARARVTRIDSDIACDPGFKINADPALLTIVIDNLLGNAVAYAPANSVVMLRAKGDGVIVSNQAPMLTQADLANFGQRFWRKEAQSMGHAGLGLALASAAARALRMQLEFRLDDGMLHAILMFERLFP